MTATTTLLLPLFEAPTFTKETARAVLEPLIESIRARASHVSKKVMGNFFFGGDAQFLSERNVALIKDVGALFWVRSELLSCLEEVVKSPYDDVSAVVARAARAASLTGFEANCAHYGARSEGRFDALDRERRNAAAGASQAACQARTAKFMKDRFGESLSYQDHHCTVTGLGIEDPCVPLGMPAVSADAQQKLLSAQEKLLARHQEHQAKLGQILAQEKRKNQIANLVPLARSGVWQWSGGDCSKPVRPKKTDSPMGVDGSIPHFNAVYGWTYLGQDSLGDFYLDERARLRCVTEHFATKPDLTDVYPEHKIAAGARNGIAWMKHALALIEHRKRMP
jgi:hypothetical protein